MATPELALVAILSPNGVIGRDGGMPWHYPEDLKHFRRVTKGHAVVMGRKTHESIGRPLPKRRNLVVTRDPTLRLEGCECVTSLQEAIAAARRDDDEPRVIGGGELFREALPHATRMFLTFTDEEYAGDTYFPDFDRTAWSEEERRRGDGVTFVTLKRKAGGEP